MGRIFLCLLTLCLSSVWGRSPCPLPHSLIPVESGFDIQKFTGIWQTVSLSGEADWTSKTWKIVQDSIGSISLVATGMGPRSTQCVPLTVYKLSELGEAGSYHMIDGDSHQQVHMKIVSTDYNYAVIHFCRHSDESVDCSQSAHVELWHRDKATVNNIGIAKSYAVDNLCLEDSSFVDLSAGLCNIPTLIADALRNVHHNNGYVSDQAENEETAEADEGQCIVNDVKIQEDFKLEWMAGLWYEISRTRFTFNTQESGVSFHQYESDSCSISSLYTGTTDGECQTAIQGISKKRTEAGKDGDLLGRIGGSDGIFSWAPMKIVYADDVHMLFYACYKILDDGSCDHDNREVTLVGRSSKTKIDEELLQTKLKELCIQPADMVPTLFEADCSDWVQKSDEIENEQTADEKEECLVDSIKTADNFIVDKILGKWYVMHTNIFKSMGRHVVSMNIYQGQGELLHIQAVLSIKHGNVSCRSEDALLSPACGQDVGDFLISPPKTMFMFRQWLSFKVLYITDTVMATYQCMMEKPDGHCEKAGIIGYLLSRDPNQPIEEEAYLKNFLQKSSLGIETWKPVEDRCDHLAEDQTKVEDSRGAKCQAFAIPSQPNIDIKKTEGIWYMIATIPDRMFERESSVYYYYEGPFEGSKHLWQAGANSNGECQELRGGIGRLRCPSNPNRGDLNRFIFPNWWTFAPVKHLYTDYEKVMLMYICLDVDFGGHCLPESQRIFIMGRRKTLDPETREKLDDIIRSACVDPDRVIDRDHLYDCTSTLEPEIAKINQAKKDKDEAIPECSLNDIKLATDFSMSKFLGTWYIVTSSYRLPIKPPAILRVSQGVGDLLHLRDITHLPDGSNRCIVGDVLLSPNCGTVDGDFMLTHLRSTSPQAKWTTLKVLYVSDTVAAVYQCVAEKPDGTCASVGGIGHILTRDLSVPIQEEAYLKSLLQEACVSIDHWVPITDYCEELQQTLSELGPESDTEARNPECQAFNIPPHQDIDLSRLQGTWYEMVKIHSPGFDWSSVMTHYEIDANGVLSITSIGVSGNSEECVQEPLMQVVRPRCSSDVSRGHYTKILKTGVWQFAPWKVLFTDYETIVIVYGCFDVDNFGHCILDQQTLFFLTKDKVIEPDWKEKYDSVIQSACIDPQVISETEHSGDCSEELIEKIKEKEEQTADEKEECLVDSIKTADNFIVDKILGKWYVMHTNFFKSMGRHVVSMNIYQGQGELLHMDAVLSIEQGNVSCMSGDALLSPACGQDVGDFFLSPPGKIFMFRQWLSFKVLYVTDTVMATYQCVMEKPNGHCEKAGIIGYLLSRDPNQPIEEEAYLKNFLQQSCVGIKNWKPVEDRCDHLAEDETKVEDSRGAECQAFAIPSQPNIDIKKTEGIWYLIATIPDRMFERESSVYYYYEGPFEGSKHLWQAGANSSGECQELRGGIGRLRCPSNPNRGDLNRFIFPNWWTFAPVKHLYTDYEKVMLMYICLDVDFGGHCLPESQRIFIMARQKTLDPETREKLDDIIRSACVDPDRVIDRDQLYDCTSTLEPEIAKINEAKKAEKDEAILECGLNYNKVAVIPECSLNDIKLATDFSMSKFLGTWYIVTSSYRLPIKPPAILRISQGVGDLLHLRDITHLPDGSNKCIMGDVLLSPNCGTVDGDFMVTHLRSTSPQAKWTTLKVLYASDTVAAVYQCVAEKPDGTCASVGGIGHILTRDLSVPIQKEAYLKSLLQDACVSIDHWFPITDYCEELQQTLSELGPESDTEARNPECQAFNIPPHQDIDLSRLQGTWYEMVKIHSPGFDWSSVMTHYEIDANGVLSITSIGVSGNSEECVQEPLMQVVRPRCSSDVSRGHYTKILAPGVWQFAPWKVLFTDYETIVIVYGCFDVDNFGHCIPDQQTLFFLTKDKVIEPDWKEKYDSVIQSACIDPQVITETEHSGDCSEELQEKIKEKEEPVLECRVDDIKLATDYSTSKLLGKWYVVASSFQKAIKQPRILRIRQGQGNPFHMRAVVRSPQINSSCEMVDVQLHPRCEEDGDFFSTHSKDTSPKTLFTSMKVLYLTESVGAVYQCAYEKPDGTCHSSAVIGHILSRDLNIAVEEKEHIKDLFKQSCVSLEHLKTNEDYCEDLEHVMSEPGPESVTGVMHPECEVFAIPPHPNLDISQVAGYWYVMAKTSNFLMTWTSVVDYYGINDNGFLSFFSTGLDDNSTCGGPLSGIVRPKCRYTSDQYVSKLFLPGHWQFSPFTILYTDYDNTLIIYICGSLDAFGQCEQKERYVFLLQRDTTLEVDWRNKYSQYFSAACVDPSLMTEMRQDGNCKGTLEAAVAKRTESRAKATEVIQVDEDV